MKMISDECARRFSFMLLLINGPCWLESCSEGMDPFICKWCMMMGVLCSYEFPKCMLNLIVVFWSENINGEMICESSGLSVNSKSSSGWTNDFWMYQWKMNLMKKFNHLIVILISAFEGCFFFFFCLEPALRFPSLYWSFNYFVPTSTWNS
jgi:hypothetical protein